MGNTDEEIKKLCKQIYSNNKEAIDIIIEESTKLYSDFIIKIEKQIKNQNQEIKETIDKIQTKIGTTYRYYGSYYAHYEITIPYEKEIHIGFHIEKNIKEKQEFVDRLYSENKTKLEQEEFQKFKESDPSAIGIRYIEKLEEPFYILTPENIEKLIQKLVSKFEVLYETINNHVKEELWKETD